MATLPKVLINRADYQIGGGAALRLRTQDLLMVWDCSPDVDMKAEKFGLL